VCNLISSPAPRGVRTWGQATRVCGLRQLLLGPYARAEYKVLRQFRPRAADDPATETPVRLGSVVDIETTGPNPLRNEIIELAIGKELSYGHDCTEQNVPCARTPPRLASQTLDLACANRTLGQSA
jgi:hypothetical protein